ncbi:MAG: hypothetical protein HKP61_03420 [Dactylosporangium sp.]|nr:hypothetical protein [Dactylosporangium sp.]NNJ60004.1 hypothetical protein [Dactylosporangium sp.]
MTHHSERLGDGVGLLRWADTPTMLLAKYPDAQPIPVRHAKHPQTGRAIVLNGGYRLAGLVNDDDVWRVTFDSDRMTSLEWWGAAHGGDWRGVEQAVEAMMGVLSHRYGFGPVGDLHAADDASWVSDGVRVDYRVEGDLYLIHIAPASAFEASASA